MGKRITNNQLLGELGEAAARKRFLELGFQFDVRSRLEAGIDAIAEVMLDGQPLAKMIAVQVKSTEASTYTSENSDSFSYLLRSEDLDYWRGSNLPVILVLYRRSDESFFWKEVPADTGTQQRKLIFDKAHDVLDRSAADSIAQLTVPKAGFGYYVPPLGDGEDAIVNMLPLDLPDEIFVATTPYSPKQAMAILFDGEETPRFDWVIKGRSFWSFNDPRDAATRAIVDEDQIEAIDTSDIAFHEDIDEQGSFAHLLRQTLRHEFDNDLGWIKDQRLFYFRAEAENTDRTFYYRSAKNRTDADVVNVSRPKKDPDKVDFVRHHAFIPRFELLLKRWYLIITPTYFFTTNGFLPHSYPQALLAGKKRKDNNASLRGQVIMWHRFLSRDNEKKDDLFGSEDTDRYLKFGEPPIVSLPTTVPEDAWRSRKSSLDTKDAQEAFQLD